MNIAGNDTVSTCPEDQRSIAIREFIEDRFERCYGASISCSYPRLLAVQDSHGCCLAAAGYRGPEESFFLEQYLPCSIEQHLSNYSKTPISRGQLVEVGNLTGVDPRAVYLLLDSLWSELAHQRYRYVALTATAQIRKRLRGLPYWKLATACRNNVSACENWGSYYANAPWVIAGQLHEYDQRYRQRTHRSPSSTGQLINSRGWMIVDITNEGAGL